jgi:predicted nucleic acid-binding protein
VVSSNKNKKRKRKKARVKMFFWIMLALAVSSLLIIDYMAYKNKKRRILKQMDGSYLQHLKEK